MQFQDETLNSWFPPGSFLREKNYPYFHIRLKKRGRGDLSQKIGECSHSGIGIRCPEDRTFGMIPLRCNRRICPECARHFMARTIEQFTPILFYTQDSSSYCLRYHTFTIAASKRKPLFHKLEIMSKSLRDFWRYEYGKRAENPVPAAGALFGIEVGRGWNVHAHALIFGPFRSSKQQNYHFRDIVSKHGGFSVWYEVRQTTPTIQSIVELVQYPLNPKKQEGIDENLLAEIEVAFSSDRKTKKASIRRIWTCGAFFNKFHRPESAHCICPQCQSKMKIATGDLATVGNHVIFENFFHTEYRWECRHQLFVKDSEKK